MARNKRNPAAGESRPKQTVRADSRAQNEQLPRGEVTPLEGSEALQPGSPPPEASSDSIKGQIRAARNYGTVYEGEPAPLPDGHVKEMFREIWQRVGFYSSHPNNNPTAVNEAQIKSMMDKSVKLGKIVTQYRLYINKPMGKRAMLIQYPNREVGQEYRAATGNKPLEIRIKPKCGLVEVDIPVDVHVNYNEEKGVEYGEAMRKSQLLQEGGSYSLGGGLGLGSRPTSKGERRALPSEGPSHEKLLENFDDANNKGHVMNKITLGGQIYPFKNGDPIYMAATFNEGEMIRSGHHKTFLINILQTSALGRKWMHSSNYGPTSATLMLSTRRRRSCFDQSGFRTFAIMLSKNPKPGLSIWLSNRPKEVRRICTEE